MKIKYKLSENEYENIKKYSGLESCDLKGFLYSHHSMIQLAEQKAELLYLNDKGLVSDQMEGIVNLIDWIQDQINKYQSVPTDIVYPITENNVKYEITLPTTPTFKEKLKTIQHITLEQCPTLINNENSWIAKYAKYCLKKGRLDPCGYIIKFLD